MPYDPTAANSLFQELQIARVELESLKRERAMLVGALKIAKHMLKPEESETIESALSATEPQATQWLEDKIAEAFNEQAEVWDVIGYSKLRTPAEELRLSASKRKEQV